MEWTRSGNAATKNNYLCLAILNRQLWALVIREISQLLRLKRKNRLDFIFRQFSEHFVRADRNYVTDIFIELNLTVEVASDKRVNSNGCICTVQVHTSAR